MSKNRYFPALILCLIALSTQAQEAAQSFYTTSITSYQPQHSSASDIAKILNEQFADFGLRLSANSSTNTVYGRIPGAVEDEVHRFFERLEKDAQRRAEENLANTARKDRSASNLVTKIFHLEHVRASSMLDTVGSLGYSNQATIAKGPNDESIIVRGEESTLTELEAMISNLDRPGSGRSLQSFRNALGGYPRSRNTANGSFNTARDSTSRPFSANRNPAASFGFSTGQAETSGSVLNAAETDKAKRLRTAYETAEKSAAKYADRLRRLRTVENADENERDRLAKLIHELVSEAFQKRQELKRLQVDSAMKQLDEIRERLDSRKKIAPKIIQRRVDELISGTDLSWLTEIDRSSNEQHIADLVGLAAKQAEVAERTQKNQVAELTGDLKGETSIEFVPELGTLIVRGAKEDVDRVVEVIESIEKPGKDQGSSSDSVNSGKEGDPERSVQKN